MRSPVAFMRFVAKAALNAAGFGVAGDLAIDVLPELARDVWNWWGKDGNQEQLRAEVQALAQLPPGEARKQAEQAVAEEASGQPEAIRKALTVYLAQVPAAIRCSQRRPADPSGCGLLHLSLVKSTDLLPLLPAHLPRFQPGDRPAGIGDWELEELLGSGGFGEVWRARNPHVPEPVALKFCLDATAAQWLRHEAALLGRVMSQGRHPGIVHLLDTYLSADPPCLKYEYVAGGDLGGLISQWQREPPADKVEQTTRLMQQLADVIRFAHRLNPPIVHRDLKPANILLQPTTDSVPRLRVADFGIGGIAARQAREQTMRGVTRGQFLATALRGSCTPLYASPQQQRGEDPDPRDDVYSLGVIWYQLLTGDLQTGASADWRDEVEPLQLPDGILRLMGACLASRPDKRPADAGALADELTRVGSPAATRVVAPPAPTVHPEPAPPTRQAPPSDPEPPAVAPPPPPRPPRASTPRPPVAAPLPSAAGPAAAKARPRPVLRPAASFPAHVTNSIGMKFVLVPQGTLWMGSPPDEVGRQADEVQHVVTITRPFYLAVYPVTQEQYQRLLKTNPSHFSPWGRGKVQVKGQDTRLFPVERVTWGNAVSFCRKLSELAAEAQSGRVYRLPTEAEWEHACRFGDPVPQPFHFGDSLAAAQANFDGRQPYGDAERGDNLKRTTAVGSYPPSRLGLFDLHGNVLEWCADWYGETYYSESPAEDPLGPETGEFRAARGGSWSSPASECRTAHRGMLGPGTHASNVGFRVLLEVPEE